MKIGLLSWILDRQRTGIDTYLYNIVMEMINQGHADKISLIHYKKSDDIIYSMVNDVIVDTIHFNPIVPIVNPVKLSNAVKETGIDILHLPSAYGPSDQSIFD